MWKALKSIFGNSRSTSTGQTYTIRMGEVTKTDAVFDALATGDLRVMLKAFNKKTNLIDRHLLLMEIVKQTYKNRKDAKMRELCKDIAEQHLQEFPRIAPALKKDMGGTLPRVPTFQHFATILTEDQEFVDAIRICETAIAYRAIAYQVTW